MSILPEDESQMLSRLVANDQLVEDGYSHRPKVVGVDPYSLVYRVSQVQAVEKQRPYNVIRVGYEESEHNPCLDVSDIKSFSVYLDTRVDEGNSHKCYVEVAGGKGEWWRYVFGFNPETGQVSGAKTRSGVRQIRKVVGILSSFMGKQVDGNEAKEILDVNAQIMRMNGHQDLSEAVLEEVAVA